MIEFKTSKGSFKVQLFDKQAPVSVENFLRYVDEGFFDGTVFHRVIAGFMIQGGGLTAELKNKAGHEPIKNEATNGLKNKRGTLAMARTNDINSATSHAAPNHYVGSAKRTSATRDSPDDSTSIGLIAVIYWAIAGLSHAVFFSQHG